MDIFSVKITTVRITVCPRSSGTFYIGDYFIDWVTTYWTYSYRPGKNNLTQDRGKTAETASLHLPRCRLALLTGNIHALTSPILGGGGSGSGSSTLMEFLIPRFILSTIVAKRLDGNYNRLRSFAF